jgi:protein gp37
MSDHSTIEWTDATWNPVTGCTEISPGCDHCYARTFSERFRGVSGHPYEQGFDLKLWEQRLELPLRWRQPKRVFVNSMSDLFHEDVPADYIHRVFDVMQRAPWHIFQLLTKRPRRMADMAPELPWPSQVWAGTSIELDRYTWRANHCLRRVPAAVRFISAEPLLGPLPSLQLDHLRWVITGGESGPRHRPCNPDWVRDLRDRCQAAGVAFFLKQWGGRTPKAGGRELDGRTWDEMPAVLTPQTPVAPLSQSAKADFAPLLP